MKYNGFNPELERLHQDGTEWRFGGLSQPGLVHIPENERDQYLPLGEVQTAKDGDDEDCATRGPLNILEAQFTYAYRNGIFYPELCTWLEDNGYVGPDKRITFSNRFNAIKSGTTRLGNSMKAPLQSIHSDGLIPEKLLPNDPTLTFAEYMDGITAAMNDLGKEFKKRFFINYEQVQPMHMDDLYKDEMIVLAGYAWPQPVNGEYPDPGDKEANHVFLGVRNPKHTILDNYKDAIGSFFKKLAANYTLYEYGYRVYISGQNVPEITDQVLQTFSLFNLWSAFAAWWTAFTLGPKPPPPVIKSLEIDPPSAPIEPPPDIETPQEKLLEASHAALGHDLTPEDAVPDEVDCAESLSVVLGNALGSFKLLTYTPDLAAALKADPRFEATLDFEPGNVIVSPTIPGNIYPGHCGVLAENNRIHSNESNTGLWTDNFSVANWIARYKTKGKMHVYLFKPASTAKSQ
jgi:hypothetical protein